MDCDETLACTEPATWQGVCDGYTIWLCEQHRWVNPDPAGLQSDPCHWTRKWVDGAWVACNDTTDQGYPD